MNDKLEAIYNRWQDIEAQLNDPAIMSDMKRYVKLHRDYKELKPVAEAYIRHSKLLADIESAREILFNDKDEELKAMAREELNFLSPEKEQLEEEIHILLLPTDPEDSKNAVLEIRAGTGGDEASIFAGDLIRMYSRFCERKGWTLELVDSAEGTVGGYKEFIANIIGENVYGIMKYESGVHRVQRVPVTETQGRVHTSAATIAVLPQADEFDVEILNDDIRKDTYCSSGPGGQSVNTTYSAVRLTHIPTGIVVQCQDQKSQTKNYEKALDVLRTRIYEMEHQKYLDEIASKRRTMVSTGDRSAKIRTYNYPQGRVTDHRIGLSIYNLQAFMDGDISDMIEALQLAENAERLKTTD